MNMFFSVSDNGIGLEEGVQAGSTIIHYRILELFSFHHILNSSFLLNI